MPAREKTSATFLAAAVVGRGTLESLGEAEFGGFAVGGSAGPRYKPVRGELIGRSSRFVNHTASAAQTTSPPRTDKTAMDFRRLLPGIRWQSCLFPVRHSGQTGDRPACPRGAKGAPRSEEHTS